MKSYFKTLVSIVKQIVKLGGSLMCLILLPIILPFYLLFFECKYRVTLGKWFTWKELIQYVNNNELQVK